MCRPISADERCPLRVERARHTYAHCWLEIDTLQSFHWHFSRFATELYFEKSHNVGIESLMERGAVKARSVLAKLGNRGYRGVAKLEGEMTRVWYQWYSCF